MAKFFRVSWVLILALCTAFAAEAGTRERCVSKLSKDGFSVSLSRAYNGLTIAPLAACAVMTSGACLGAALGEIAADIGLDLTVLALRNFNTLVSQNGKQIQAGICSKDYKLAGITLTDYYFYVRHRAEQNPPPPPPEVENLHEYVRGFYAEWGYVIEGANLDHWVAHHLNVGRDKWNEDALRNIIIWRYDDWALRIAEADLNFWYSHLLHAGRYVWEEHQRKSVIQTLFSKCGVNIGDGAELEHWYRHSLNVNRVQFVLDLTNGRTCKFEH